MDIIGECRSFNINVVYIHSWCPMLLLFFFFGCVTPCFVVYHIITHIHTLTHPHTITDPTPTPHTHPTSLTPYTPHTNPPHSHTPHTLTPTHKPPQSPQTPPQTHITSLKMVRFLAESLSELDPHAWMMPVTFMPVMVQSKGGLKRLATGKLSKLFLIERR